MMKTRISGHDSTGCLSLVQKWTKAKYHCNKPLIKCYIVNYFKSLHANCRHAI